MNLFTINGWDVGCLLFDFLVGITLRLIGGGYKNTVICILIATFTYTVYAWHLD